MSVYAISDLHLALGIDKPMDIFGDRWSNYMDRIKTNWEENVTVTDHVVIPGDISWATYTEQATEDFRFIDSLPGKKIISKGNHDYWWTTIGKLNRFLLKNNFTTISFMHNNSFNIEKYAICGTRGWKCPQDEDFSVEDEKIYNRELQRLELSLKSTVENKERILVTALHYPPFSVQGKSSGFIEIMQKYGVDICIYGHLHGEASRSIVDEYRDGIYFRFVAADRLDFKLLNLEEIR